jgi:hypothetical protein
MPDGYPSQRAGKLGLSGRGRSVRPGPDHERMWSVDIVCSDPECEWQAEVLLDELGEAELLVCECGHCAVVRAVAQFEALYLSMDGRSAGARALALSADPA